MQAEIARELWQCVFSKHENTRGTILKLLASGLMKAALMFAAAVGTGDFHVVGLLLKGSLKLKNQ